MVGKAGEEISRNARSRLLYFISECSHAINAGSVYRCTHVPGKRWRVRFSVFHQLLRTCKLKPSSGLAPDSLDSIGDAFTEEEKSAKRPMKLHWKNKRSQFEGHQSLANDGIRALPKSPSPSRL